jgi:NAD(P)-dependent dehydrogenase (short-subunit alcohol dehydrogenase family)
MAGAGRMLEIPTDVSDETSVKALFATIESTFGRLDLLFNNAGTGAPASAIEDIPLSAWRTVINTNLTGTFLCTQGALRIMKSQTPRGGRIINNGSIAIYAPRPHSAASTAAKQAILGLTRATALEGRDYDIACGQINIGNADTSMTERIKVHEPVIDVSNVARAVQFMASLPLDANVLSLDVMATKMPLLGRG